MPNIATLLSTHFHAAICAAFGDAAGKADPLVGPSQQEQHGDYQSNAAMSLAKTLGQKPREVAEKIKASKEQNFGFNASTERYEDLVKAGVIDPTKVTRTALQNAASIASLMLTTEAMICGLVEESDS